MPRAARILAACLLLGVHACTNEPAQNQNADAVLEGSEPATKKETQASLRLPRLEAFPGLEAAWALQIQKKHSKNSPQLFPLYFEKLASARLLTANELLKNPGEILFLELLPPPSENPAQRLSWAAHLEILLSKISQVPMGDFSLPEVIHPKSTPSTLPNVAEETFFKVIPSENSSELQQSLCEKVKGLVYAGQLLSSDTAVSRGRQGNELSLRCKLRHFADEPQEGSRMLMGSFALPLVHKEDKAALFKSLNDLTNLAKLQLIQN